MIGVCDADTAKAGDVLGTALGLPVPLAAALFVATVGGSCFLSSAQQMDKINSALVGLVVVVFLVRHPLPHSRPRQLSSCVALCCSETVDDSIAQHRGVSGILRLACLHF